MLDSDDCTLSLDDLFFEKPLVHKVKPLHQEARPWQLEAPPSLSQIPATQDMQEEADFLSTLCSFSQKPKILQPPSRRFASPINSPHSYNNDEEEIETQGGNNSIGTDRCDGFWGGDGFKDYCQSGRGGDERHASMSQRCLSLGLSKSPPLRRSLFKVQVLNNGASSRPPQQAAHAEMQDKGTKRVFVPPMTPQALCIQGSSGSGVLRPVSEIPAKFRSVFNEFPFFNYIQSKALDDVLYTGNNFVACAPTGSGKTVLFELAIIRLLMETSEPWRDFKAVYMAPIKALCSQCFESWKKKFGPLGLTCKELTGDTEIDDFFEIQDSHIILTTPEKWDSMTRKWKDNCLLQLVRLFLIDEVHVVKDATRGATLEVVVSRMKAVNAHRTAQNPETGLSMRFVAVSATIPNISDIADWLSNESGPATYLDMDESHRPVKLRKVVLGFPCSPNQTEFKFDLSLNYKMVNIIQTYSEQKPTLVFCSTRKGAQQSATVLAKDARFIMSIEHKQRLMKYANSVLDSKLKDLVMLGVGYHHAGLDMSDRKLIERAFTLADLPVLFTTRTLAMGVNLPAHLVVIKSTMQYVAGSCEEYSEADILQMIGRAGRPQFDTSATAVIMTKIQTKDKYMKLMNGMEIIESSLHSHLMEHLNAEIVLQTISDVNMALDWIRSTLLYIRALKNPTHYGFSADLDRYGIEAKLQELCLRNLNSLSSIGLIDMDEDINIKPTEAGRLMARYCVAFDTMKQFSQVAGTENLSDLIELMSKSREFSDFQLRMNEKRPLNTLNRDKNRTTIRFPIEGKIKTSEMKVNCLIQAQLGFHPDSRVWTHTGHGKDLQERDAHQQMPVRAAGEDRPDPVNCHGERRTHHFHQIEETNARELELILNRHPPFGNQIKESVIHLPKYEVTLEQLPRYSSATAEIVVKVNLKNQAELLSKRTAPDHHYVSLIIGNSDNTVVFLQKLTDSVLLKCGSWSKKIEVAKASKGEEISVNLISSEYVGLDLQQKFNVYYSGARSLYIKAATQRQTSTSATDPGNTRQCNHFCKNKDHCGHDCCKVGVTVTRKRTANHESSFSSYLNDLRTRSDTLAQTPVKRLKMRMSEESVYGGSRCEALVRPRTETVDLTGEDFDQLRDVVHLDDTDSGSSMWVNPGISVGVSQNQKPHLNQISTTNSTYSKMSTAGSDQSALRECASFSQIPTISFDLGNEWDDFDDENLVRASETSLSLCPTNARPQVQQQPADYNMPGFAAATAPMFLSHSQVEPCITTEARTPLRLISPTLNSEIRRPGASPFTARPQNRITLDWNKKRPSVFREEITVKAPENLPKQSKTHFAPPTKRFDFFSSMSVPANTDPSSSNNRRTSSKEEEAFIGIFDGIF
ncbi:putative ATP-dependent DNA helicase HFM1 [Larimichthys crocea]|uniref:DNA 3'-5' helicase n=1 Tax=Larimichthys crocea TaxID=215358 RepID=A0A6G0IIN6_LARCR|nr:putative ATP-dependent DNA helicase HFM1 [Larimichthys crocea]